jgi:hypothetical protein
MLTQGAEFNEVRMPEKIHVYAAVRPGSDVRISRTHRLLSRLFDAYPDADISLKANGKPMPVQDLELFGRHITYDSQPGFSRGMYRNDLRCDLAVAFSPFFPHLDRLMRSANRVWVDMFDDWSISPHVRFPDRQFARYRYRQIRQRTGDNVLVTAVNQYMKIKTDAHLVIPNGVDVPQVVDFRARASGSQLTVIVLGSFSPYRTDTRLIKSLLSDSRLREVRWVFAGPGVAWLKREVFQEPERRLKFREFITWLQVQDLVRNEGAISFIPHLVNDYTLSQDLMKAYQFVASGSVILIPRLLLPKELPTSRVVVFNDKDDVGELVLMSGQLGSPAWGLDSCTEFATESSWDRRWAAVREML